MACVLNLRISSSQIMNGPILSSTIYKDAAVPMGHLVHPMERQSGSLLEVSTNILHLHQCVPPDGL